MNTGRKRIVGVIFALSLVCEVVAGPLDHVAILNSKISVVEAPKLPSYVRIDADLLNESSDDLSGEWIRLTQRGHFTLRENGIDHVALYLWGEFMQDTSRGTVELYWISDVDPYVSDTLVIALDWKYLYHLNAPPEGEFSCGEMKRDSDLLQYYVDLIIPVPTDVLLLRENGRKAPPDTLFFEQNFRGEKRVILDHERGDRNDLNCSLYIDGEKIESKRLIEPVEKKKKRSGNYYYGE